MNNITYEILVQKKLPAAAPKEIRYRVRRVVKNHVVRFISTPIIEEPTEEPQPFDMYR